MIEIESKFKLASDITRDNLIAILKSQFIALISSKRQIDTVFLQPDYHGVLFEYDEMPYIDYPWEYTSLKDFQKEDKAC